jgi:hypothetical protein
MPPRKPKTLPAPARPTPPETAAKALAAVAERLRLLAPADVLPVNTDVPRAVSIALGAAPRVAELRPAIAEHLPRFDLAHVDALPTLAMAAWYAHLQWVSSTDDTSTSELDVILARATELRRMLLGDADALALRGLVDPSRVAEIREGRGHLDTANDLVALSALLEESWPRIEGRTAASREEVEEAAVQGTRLLVALSRRGEAGAAIAPVGDAADLRARAFTALRKAYHQCRRAVAYLRWDEGDLDVLVPSLFARRKPQRARPEAADDLAAEPPAPEPGGTAGPREDLDVVSR